ncbi:MAG TPA: hypothetical protein VFG04_03780 [Planctomycetaceae bacterium]|nr:hypothetical protein [Planctomycetaceae bacterium]
MSGLQLNEDRSVKVLDSHNDESISNIKGRLHNLRIENGQTVGDLEMDEGEVDAVRKVDKGFVDRMSAGYYADDYEMVEKGQTREYTWEEDAPEKEGDENNLRKARSDEDCDCDCEGGEDCDCCDDEDRCDKDDRCEEDRDDDDDEMRKDGRKKSKRSPRPKPTPGEDGTRRRIKRKLVVSGPAVVTTSWRLKEASLVAIPADDDAKIRADFLHTLQARNGSERKTETSRRPMEQETKVETPAVDEKAIAERAVKEYQTFRTRVRKQIEGAGLALDVDEICEAANSDYGRACEEIVNRMATAQKKPEHVVVGDDERVKARSLVKDLMKHRALNMLKDNADPRTRTEFFEKEMPKGDFDKFSRWGYRDIARMLLESQGQSCRDLSGNEILERAWYGTRDGVGLPTVTPGSLPNILLDAVNVSLALQYRAADTTFDKVGRKADDFIGMFDVHIQRISNVNSLDVWPAGEDPKQKKLFDAPSTWKAVNYGNNIVIDYNFLLADRLDVISTVPASLAWAAKRTFNQNFWALISGNQTVQEDAKALFDASHNNTCSNQTDPYNGNASTNGTSVWNLSKMRSLMRQQRGLDGSLIRLTPTFLVVPTTLETQGDITVQSPSSPIPNVFMGLQTFKGSLTTLVEPELDANSTTAFYMMSEPMMACAGYCYHEGQSTPIIDSFIFQPNRSMIYQVAQAGAVGLVDYRSNVKYIGT